MTQLSISTPNAKLVRMGLQNLSAEIPKIGKNQIYKTMTKVITIIKVYPPQPAGSKYKRTFRLQKSWTVEANGEMGYTIKSNAVTPRGRLYTKYVVGTAYGTEQAGQNAHWKLLRDVMDKEVEKLPKAISEEIRLVARRNNL